MALQPLLPRCSTAPSRAWRWWSESSLPRGRPLGPSGSPEDRLPIRCKLRVMVNAAMGMVRRSVRKRCGMDILKLKPIENVHTCFIPSLFVAGVPRRISSPIDRLFLEGI